uniref:Reverse transcriptase zinc-binding domain-containing protein n=1 Tax=Setaria italica TaxID=4555 RepID=K3YFM3_SETIT
MAAGPAQDTVQNKPTAQEHRRQCLCEVCNSGSESTDHLILHCSFATQFWAAIGVEISGTASVSTLWELQRPPTVPDAFYSTYLLLCSWQLWKHRHDVVFRGLEPSLPRLLLSCKEEARLWSCRLPRADRLVAEAWCAPFSFNM